jgi:hypothetical protein
MKQRELSVEKLGFKYSKGNFRFLLQIQENQKFTSDSAYQTIPAINLWALQLNAWWELRREVY